MYYLIYAIWECQFLTQNGPNSPQNHPKRSQLFSNILCDINLLHNRTERPLLGRKLPKKAKKGKFCNPIIRPNLFNTVKYALNTIRRIVRIRRMTHIPGKTFLKETWGHSVHSKFIVNARTVVSQRTQQSQNLQKKRRVTACPVKLKLYLLCTARSQLHFTSAGGDHWRSLHCTDHWR